MRYESTIKIWQAWDNLDMLTLAEYGIDDTNEAFTIDDLGNRKNVNVRDGNDITYTVDNLTNRYMSVADVNLNYNAAGDLIKDKDSYEYEYDYENRIVKITKDGNDMAEFAYDALGRRVEKKDLIDPNNTRRYYYNYKWQVLTEYNGSGVFQQWYAYGNYIDEVLAKGTTPSPASARFYIHDHLYSPAVLTTWTGTILERYEYDAYGSPTIWNADFTTERDSSNYGNPYLFTGRRVDILDSGSLKIQYNRNRYYDYYSGRWLTHDPLGITPNPLILSKKHDTIDRYAHNKYNSTDSYRWLKSPLLKVRSNLESTRSIWPKTQYSDGRNLFEYGGSNPVMYLDPYGLQKCNCGPSIDIALIKLDMALYRAWKSWGLWERIKRCTWMYDPTTLWGGVGHS